MFKVSVESHSKPPKACSMHARWNQIRQYYTTYIDTDSIEYMYTIESAHASLLAPACLLLRYLILFEFLIFVAKIKKYR